MLTVHLRINDAATGKPTAVRLRIAGPDGTTYPPLGRFAEFAPGRNEDVGGHLWVGKEAWCYVEGSCEVKLPAGVPLRVRATKGPEYRPLDETVTLGPGQMALRFTIERWSNLRESGWYSGDARCHFIPPHAALLEAAAEDLDVTNLLAAFQMLPSFDGKAYPTAPNLTAFSGQAPALEAHGRLVAVNTLNAHPVLGRVGLLYSHRPVFPLAFGDEDTDDWSVCDWCDQCHRKGGLTVWADPFRPTGGLVGGEALVAAVLGKIDALEVGLQPPLTWVYRLWNTGFLVPLAGASGKDGNRTPLGAVRTYARLASEPFTYKAWVEAVRAGRSFVTTGPLLTLDVGGHGPGGVIESDTNPFTIRATAASLTPFEKLEVVVNGDVVQSVATTAGDTLTAELAFAHTPTEPGWVAARTVGGANPSLPPGTVQFAHTSPVVVRLGGHPLPCRPAAAQPLRDAIAATVEWVETAGRFEQPKRKQQLLDHCTAAVARLSR